MLKPYLLIYDPPYTTQPYDDLQEAIIDAEGLAEDRRRTSVYVLLTERKYVLFDAIAKRNGSYKTDIISDAEIEILIARRSQARQNRDWKTADDIRNKLKNRGITLIDKADSSIKWYRDYL